MYHTSHFVLFGVTAFDLSPLEMVEMYTELDLIIITSNFLHYIILFTAAKAEDIL